MTASFRATGHGRPPHGEARAVVGRGGDSTASFTSPGTDGLRAAKAAEVVLASAYMRAGVEVAS